MKLEQGGESGGYGHGQRAQILSDTFMPKALG